MLVLCKHVQTDRLISVCNQKPYKSKRSVCAMDNGGLVLEWLVSKKRRGLGEGPPSTCWVAVVGVPRRSGLRITIHNLTQQQHLFQTTQCSRAFVHERQPIPTKTQAAASQASQDSHDEDECDESTKNLPQDRVARKESYVRFFLHHHLRLQHNQTTNRQILFFDY